MPGMVDPHVHAHDELRAIDSYETATRAAALGGITTFINFAWEGWDSEESPYDTDTTILTGIDRQRSAGEAGAVVDFGVHAVLVNETQSNLERIEEAVRAGVPSFKVFTAYEIGLSNGFIDQLLRRIGELGAVGVFHTEDQDVCDHLTEKLKRENRGDSEDYPDSRPDYTEAMAADAVARLAQEADAQYYGVHTTSRKAADVLERYQEDGSKIRAETCTHYTVHDDSIYGSLGNLPLMAPPIRSPDDIEAMFEHLREGALSVVSTDHSSYKKESKQVDNWWECDTFGVNSLQRSLPVFHDEAVIKRDFSYPDLVRLMSTNPARTFGLPNKGSLDPGTDADVIIFDPSHTHTISAADNAAAADFSIYEGAEVAGWVEKTFVRGQLVADDGEVVVNPGHGEFIERKLPEWGNTQVYSRD
jgi:dihydropyrimidinase